MKWNDHNSKLCSIARTLGLIGEPWTLLIIRNSFLGAKRFEDFQSQLGLTRHVLSDRLKMLVANEVLKKVPYGEKAGRFEYRLTTKGRSLYPIIVTMTNWGDTWMSDENGPPITYVHAKCGNETQPVMTCACCGEALNAQDMQIKRSAQMDALVERLAPAELARELGFPVPGIKVR